MLLLVYLSLSNCIVASRMHQLITSLNQLRIPCVAFVNFSLQVLDVVFQKVKHAVFLRAFTLVFSFLQGFSHHDRLGFNSVVLAFEETEVLVHVGFELAWNTLSRQARPSLIDQRL